MLEQRKVIHIATPIVWAEAEMINHYTENLSRLIPVLNNAFQQAGERMAVEKAVVDVHSVAEKTVLDSHENIDLISFNTAVGQREDKGMAHWWYASVRRAFDFSSSVFEDSFDFSSFGFENGF